MINERDAMFFFLFSFFLNSVYFFRIVCHMLMLFHSSHAFPSRRHECLFVSRLIYSSGHLRFSRRAQIRETLFRFPLYVITKIYEEHAKTRRFNARKRNDKTGKHIYFSPIFSASISSFRFRILHFDAAFYNDWQRYVTTRGNLTLSFLNR